MRKKERFEKILEWFRINRPIAETELHYRTPYELLVAVMLSAQCTDKRVNLVTPALFNAYPDAEALAKAALADKKRSGDGITIVVPKAIGDCELKRIPVTELLPIIAAGLGE